jgi:hypothetical protein
VHASCGFRPALEDNELDHRAPNQTGLYIGEYRSVKGGGYLPPSDSGKRLGTAKKEPAPFVSSRIRVNPIEPGPQFRPLVDLVHLPLTQIRTH